MSHEEEWSLQGGEAAAFGWGALSAGAEAVETVACLDKGLVVAGDIKIKLLDVECAELEAVVAELKSIPHTLKEEKR